LTAIGGSLLQEARGCGNTYTYNNKTFHSADKAHAAHAEHLKSIEDDIEPVGSSTAGSAAIITPSQKTCEALGVTRKGHPDQDMISYVGKYLENDFAYFENYLKKSEMFNSVIHEINDFPQHRAKEVNERYVATIYLELKSPNQSSWFLMTPHANSPMPIHFDNMAAVGAPKVQSWLNDIYEKLDRGNDD
jgi:hypothetical protein